MLKKLIILLTVFAIENSINCAEAQNPIAINYITKITPADLAQIAPNDVCAICQKSFIYTSNLYKSNCPQILTPPHIFHRNCILGWIRSGKPSARNCPVCHKQMVDNTDLISAILRGDLETLRLLLDLGADINARTNSKDTALMLASRYGHLETVRLLIDRGADINAINLLRNTALMAASRYEHLEIVRLLIDRGADINAKTIVGDTALIETSCRGDLETVRLLLDLGADINARAIDGKTALIEAHQNGHQEIADLLIARGAV